ncbi:MAG: site-2 protease family protein, partial [Chitinispirillaceae bacterium]|nr:site-2 protease family protein [Chitinispirillaceae bacterium]
MFGKKFKVFTLSGFDVNIDLSWIFLTLLIVWSLATGVFPFYIAGLSPQAYLWLAIAGMLGLFASIIVHEFSHSLIARRFGIPMEGITLFIFGGVAKMNDEPPGPKAEFFIAVAGPLASIAIGTGILLISRLVPVDGPQGAVKALLTYLGTINLVLAGFNLIPAFPLDGGRILRSALWAWKGDIRKATRIASASGSVFGWFLMGAGVLNLFMGGFIGGLWYILIGIFIHHAADVAYRQLVVRQTLEGEPVNRFMTAQPLTVPQDTTIEHFINDYVYRYHHKMFPVRENGAKPSCITTGDIGGLPREQWPSHAISEFMHACSDANAVDRNTDAVAALVKMRETGNSRLIVTDDKGALCGVVTLKDLLGFLSIKLDLEKENRFSEKSKQVNVRQKELTVP